MVRVVNDPAEAAARGANAFAHARAELSGDRLLPHFEAVYSQAIHHHALDSK